jgi:hypothetical protein
MEIKTNCKEKKNNKNKKDKNNLKIQSQKIKKI